MAQTRVGCLAGIVLSAVLALAFSTDPWDVAKSEQASHEDRFLASEDGWDTYVNGRFGMRLTYPAYLFAPAAAPPDGGGRRFEAEDARIEVSAWRNEAGVTPSDLASQLTEAEGYQEIARQEVDEARLVLSGARADRVFHEEYHFEGATVQALGMEFPVERRAIYEPLAKAMAGAFIRGADTGAEETGEPPSTVARSVDPESSDEAQETGPQAAEPDAAAAVDAAHPEVVDETSAQPAEEAPAPAAEEAPAPAAEEAPAQAAEGPPAQSAEEPPAPAAEEAPAQPHHHQQEATVPLPRAHITRTRGEGAGTSSGDSAEGSSGGESSEGGDSGEGGDGGEGGDSGEGGDGGEGGDSGEGGDGGDGGDGGEG